MDASLTDTARRIVSRLQEAGFQAYWVGGCVRDRLLGLEPKDYDIATSALPDQVRALFPRAGLVGAHFGVVLARMGGRDFEIATFRGEGGYEDHRHPSEVVFGDLERDAQRRDFTINALYLDPIEDRLVDLVDGRSDLERRILRAIGDPSKRFEEDALRLIRAARFAARFNLEIEPLTAAAIREKAGLITMVSPERVRDELLLILTGPQPGRGLTLLSEHGLLARVLPEVEAMRGVEQPPEFHPEGDVFTHTLLALEALDKPSAVLAMAALLHDVGKPPTFSREPDRVRFHEHATVGAQMADAILRRLRFSNHDRERIVELVRRHMTFMDIQRMKDSTLRRFMAAPNFDDDLALHRADCLACHGDTDNLRYVDEMRGRFEREAAAILPPPLVNGADLIEMGLEPGPLFGEILKRAQDLQLEGELADRKQALKWVKLEYGGRKRT
jgi:poly(A) polymerase